MKNLKNSYGFLENCKEIRLKRSKSKETFLKFENESQLSNIFSHHVFLLFFFLSLSYEIILTKKRVNELIKRS